MQLCRLWLVGHTLDRLIAEEGLKGGEMQQFIPKLNL